MANGKVFVYIAMSLDGFIARKDDDVSWLNPYQVGEEYGYSDFIKTVGAVIMGSRTYAQSLEHPERLFRDLKTYVLSKRPFPIVAGTDVEFYNADIDSLMTKIKKENGKNIYVVGGGQVVSSFLNSKLIDELMIFVVPILLSEGILLFSALDKEITLRFIKAIPYKTGIVQLHYVASKT